jgi:hypothetical protein
MDRWVLALALCAPWATASASDAQPIVKVLFHDLTYWSGPLTIDSETASFLLARYGPQAGDSTGHFANVPKQAIEYLIYRDRALRYSHGKPVGHTSVLFSSRKLFGRVLYPSLAAVAFGAYQVSRYRAASDRVASAERNGLAEIARRHRTARGRNETYAMVSLIAGTLGIVVANSATIQVLRIGDGTVISLYRDGRYTAERNPQTQSLGVYLRFARQ